MKKRFKKAKKQLNQITDAFACGLEQAVEGFALGSEPTRSRRKAASSDNRFAFILSLSQGEGEATKTKDPLVFWKEVAHAGVFFKGDQRIDITPRHIKHWAKTHRAMSQAGIKVPLPLEHTNCPEKSRGKVLEMAAKPNNNGIPALYAKIKFRDAEAAKMIDSGTSIYVPKEASSGYGQTFISPVQHVALTDYPVIPDLEPFTEAIALSHSPVANLPFSSGSQNHKISSQPRSQAMATVMSQTKPLYDVLVMDAASRIGHRGEISMAFPPKDDGGKPDFGKGDGGADKSEKDPAGATPPGPANPAQAAGQTPAPNGSTQKLTLRDLATQIGIDPAITDETQLLTLLSNQIMQLKAKAQAPMPPQGMPGQPPHPGMPPAPGQPPAGGPPALMPPAQPMMPPRPPMPPPQGAYGPPAMHTGRPPIQMSRAEFLRDIQQQQEEGTSLSLDDIPQEIVMALSKKQMKKVMKTIKKGKKGSGPSGDKSTVQKLNDKAHFGAEPGDNDEDETFEGDNDSFGEEDIESEGEEEGRYNPSGAGPGGLSMLDGNVLGIVKKARSVTIDSLFKQGMVNGAARKELITRFVDGQGVALSHHYDDGFDATIRMIESNGRVLNTTGKSGVQGAGVVALSNGELSDSNALEADASRRAEGRSNL